MTSTVTITAHCSDDKEVVIQKGDIKDKNPSEIIKLQDGETYEEYVYDDQAVTVHEQVKE